MMVVYVVQSHAGFLHFVITGIKLFSTNVLGGPVRAKSTMFGKKKI